MAIRARAQWSPFPRNTLTRAALCATRATGNPQQQDEQWQGRLPDSADVSSATVRNQNPGRRPASSPRARTSEGWAAPPGGNLIHGPLGIRAAWRDMRSSSSGRRNKHFAHRVRVVQIGFRYVEVCSGRWSRHAPKSNASIDFCMLGKSSTKAFPRVQGQRGERADPSRRRGARKSLGGKHLSGSNGCLKT